MSFPVEAPPESPGHVGHTPQHADVMLRRSRAQGLLSSTLALLVPTEWALQPLTRPRVQYERQSQVAALLTLQAYERNQDVRQPWPSAFRPGLELAGAPMPTKAPGATRRR